MRNLLLVLLFAAMIPNRELDFARAQLEGAIMRNDVTGMELARDRLLRLTAETGDRTVLRQAHYLAALSTLFETISGFVDPATGARATETGLREADRAIAIDPQFADAWMISAMLRSGAGRFGVAVPKDPPGAPNRMAHALELDPKSPPVAFFAAMLRSFNPNGAAPAAAVEAIDGLAARLDAERAATHRPFDLWDAETHAWQVVVRIASDEPDALLMRPMVARLLELRPDFASGRDLADAVAEHRFVAAPSVTWQPFLTDPAGDGKDPKLPDVVAVDRAGGGDRVWYRVTVHDPLPRSFGVNVVINRKGDPSAGARWWGNGSTFRFDRLVTAWISHDGDRYFGRIGVTDDDGMRGWRLARISSDVQIAMPDARTVIVGVPRESLGLTDRSTTVVAVGSHLVWNDDATTAAKSR